MVVPYEADARGDLIPSHPLEGPCRGSEGPACHLVEHDWRERRTGPCMALLVMRCTTHRRSFTLYPPGYVPYARMRLAPVVPDGGAVLVEAEGGKERRQDGVGSVAGRFAGTYFGAALDGARGELWPHGWQQPVYAGPSARWSSTQARRTRRASRLLGLAPELPFETRALVAETLGVETLLLHEESRKLGASAGVMATSRAVAVVLAALPASGCLVDRLAEAGYVVGLWPEPWRWDPRRGVLQPRPFQPVGTRAPPRPA